jgi:CheY-like chemotaxis protein
MIEDSALKDGLVRTKPRPKQALVVDDDEYLRRTEVQLLKFAGWEVITAGTFLQAWQIINQGTRPDVAVVDWKFPYAFDKKEIELIGEPVNKDFYLEKGEDVCGKGVLRLLAERSPDTGLILCTVLDDKKSLDEEVNQWLINRWLFSVTKPFDVDEFLETIDWAFSRRPTLRIPPVGNLSGVS